MMNRYFKNIPNISWKKKGKFYIKGKRIKLSYERQADLYNRLQSSIVPHTPVQQYHAKLL